MQQEIRRGIVERATMDFQELCMTLGARGGYGVGAGDA